MSSPDRSEGFFQFKECEEIAAFYAKFNITGRKTTGLLGGRSYSWFFNNNGQPFSVVCICQANTFGLGVLEISSRMASDLPTARVFRKSSAVDPSTGAVTMKSVTGLSTHEFTLPVPDRVQESSER